MSAEGETVASALVDLVRHYCGLGFNRDNAVRLAIATIELDMLNDSLVIAGDIADALNDMRPSPAPSTSVH